MRCNATKYNSRARNEKPNQQHHASSTHHRAELMFTISYGSIFIFIEHLILPVQNLIRLQFLMCHTMSFGSWLLCYSVARFISFVFSYIFLFRKDCASSFRFPSFSFAIFPPDALRSILALVVSCIYFFGLLCVCVCIHLFCDRSLVIVRWFLGERARTRSFTEHEVVCICARVNTIWWMFVMCISVVLNINENMLCLMLFRYWFLHPYIDVYCVIPIASCAFAVAT